MHIIKSLLIPASIVATLLCAGAAAASEPGGPTAVIAQNASFSADAQVAAPMARKVYLFSQLDKNHNGSLSRAEIPMDMHALRREFVRVDFDGNGEITPQEYTIYSRGQVPEYVGVSHAMTFVPSASDRPDFGVVINP